MKSLIPLSFALLGAVLFLSGCCSGSRPERPASEGTHIMEGVSVKGHVSTSYTTSKRK
ncbi:MAG: hypothetical protein ACSHX8_12710 [Opitutaceae bacterium]